MDIKKKEEVTESRKTNKRFSYCLHEGSHTGETFLMLQIDLALTSHRHRHLLNDIYSLLPHSRKDVKLDTKTKLYQLNELAELYNANNVFFFEARKNRDLYLWMSKAPNGPTVKMHMQNCK